MERPVTYAMAPALYSTQGQVKGVRPVQPCRGLLGWLPRRGYLVPTTPLPHHLYQHLRARLRISTM
jgi:hypothetical protein